MGGGHLEGWRAVSRGPGSGAALRLAALQAHHMPPEEQSPNGLHGSEDGTEGKVSEVSGGRLGRSDALRRRPFGLQPRSRNTELCSTIVCLGQCLPKQEAKADNE